MTERDFAYWLQGYFELYEAGYPGHPDNIEGFVGAFSAKQYECIKNHIALVKTTIKKPSPFLISIEALLEYDVPAMRRVLNAYFEHVIDPEHPNQDAANAAHNGGFLSGRPPGARC